MNQPARNPRDRSGESAIAAFFEARGWRVQKREAGADSGADLQLMGRDGAWVVQVLTATEGRADRVIPLLSQGILQARSAAKAVPGARALAIVHLQAAPDRLVDHVDEFVDRYGDDTAIGLITEGGLRHFRDPSAGGGLEAFNERPLAPPRRRSAASDSAVNLFSDLNQWMLKVLLAPDLPSNLLRAPRQPLRTGADLAQAAGVSTMSASRLLQQLRRDGHLDDATVPLRLVRREELLRRWQAAAMRSPVQRPMRFLLKASANRQLQQLLQASPSEVCLGLFSAADALRVGHVGGNPPHVCVPDLSLLDGPLWRSLVAAPDGRPDLIVRQAAAPQSTFRGAVTHDGIACTDVLQTWLDVASHPARGHEQAELIHDRVLRPHLLEGPVT